MLVLALKFSRNTDDKGAPFRGRWCRHRERTLPENGTERPKIPKVFRSRARLVGRLARPLAFAFQSVINVGVADLMPLNETVIGQLTP